MSRWFTRWWMILLLWVAMPRECPAPLIFRPGEGWTYETPGSEGKWTRPRASEQLEVAQQAFDARQYRLALKAARRVVHLWPLSDFAPKAQYLLARTQDARGRYEQAFKEYQKLLETYPKFTDFQGVLERQFEIANLYLAGRWFRVWGVVPVFPSMDRTVAMYEKIVKTGPFSPVAPRAQMNVGAARERQASFFNRVDPFQESVLAYERAADRYHDQNEIASEALFKAGFAYFRQASKADYDQSIAGKAIATFTDFVALYPEDPRVAEATELIGKLRSEQARGSFNTARFYEKRRKWAAAMIYYNETIANDRRGPLAAEAEQRLASLKQRTGLATPSAPSTPPAQP